MACKALRKHEASKSLPPSVVLVTSSNHSPADKQLYMAAGFDGVLCKPMDFKNVSANLLEFLEARPAAAAARNGVQRAAAARSICVQCGFQCPSRLAVAHGQRWRERGGAMGWARRLTS